MSFGILHLKVLAATPDSRHRETYLSSIIQHQPICIGCSLRHITVPAPGDGRPIGKSVTTKGIVTASLFLLFFKGKSFGQSTNQKSKIFFIYNVPLGNL
ncbi:MAG: hypothetical protein IPP06_16580 [Saprospiraceae bacterium]|nr:hypothetical protein [Candidatus Vicinibacter affinis]